MSNKDRKHSENRLVREYVPESTYIELNDELLDEKIRERFRRERHENSKHYDGYEGHHPDYKGGWY